MKMKKLLTLVLTASMALSLAACGSKNDAAANEGKLTKAKNY